MEYIKKLDRISLNLFFLSVIMVEVSFFIRSDMMLTVFNNASIICMFLLLTRIYNIISKNDIKMFLVSFIVLIIMSSLKFILQNSIDIRELLYMFVIFSGILIFSNLKINIKDLNFLRVGMYIVTIIYFIGSFDARNIGFYPENYLMFGYSNPNVLAPILVTHIIFIGLPFPRSLVSKYLDITVILLNIYMIYLTGSRTVILATFLLIIGVVTKIYKVNFITKMVSKILVFFPIVVIFFNNIINIIFKFISYFFNSDKSSSLNGREAIWSSQFSEVTSNFSQFFMGIKNNSDVYGNSHNYLLFILTHHGIIIFILYIISLFKVVVKKINEFKPNEINYYTLFSWNILIIINFFESHLSTGLISFSCLWLMLLSDYNSDIELRMESKIIK